MTKLNYKAFFVFLVLLLASFFALEGIASAQYKKTVKRDAAVAKKVLEETRHSVTTIINKNTELVSQLRAAGSCAGSIIKSSPGWFIIGGNKDDIATQETYAALNFALINSLGYTSNKTSKLSKQVENLLKSVSRKQIRSKYVKKLLKTHVDMLTKIRQVGTSATNTCQILETWQDDGYREIGSLVNNYWGENQLQKTMKNIHIIFKNRNKAINKIAKVAGDQSADKLIPSPYRRANNIYFNSFS